ncbi:MAG: hypothetical protein ACKV2V_22620 [Blastocatellia bacterium]
MTSLQTQIPDALYQQIEQLTARERVTLDQFIAMALAAQVSAWQTSNDLAERARHGSWEKTMMVLQQIPDTEPDAHDWF